MKILKHIFLLIVASLIIILAWSFFHAGAKILLHFYQLILHWLNQVLAAGPLATLIKKLLGLLIVPLGVGSILGGVYWIFKRSLMPYLFHIMWVSWLILAVAVIL